MAANAGVRFIVKGYDSCFVKPPLQLRVTGSAAVTSVGRWDVRDGVDLFWEGDRWTSLLIEVRPNTALDFCLDVSGELGTSCEGDAAASNPKRRRKCHAWGGSKRIDGIAAGSVVEVLCTIAGSGSGCKIIVTCSERVDHLVFAQRPGELGKPLPKAGSQRCYSYEAPGGPLLHFALCIPPGYTTETKQGWPLLINLHALHDRLDGSGTNNLFRALDTPLGLLLSTGSRCPQALREGFVVLVPQCPPDVARGDGSGIWLAQGYEESVYDKQFERSLRALIDNIVRSCNIDTRQIAITGASMGAYACLELASRWPGFFSAVAPVAAYYDGYYEDGLDALCERLAKAQDLPMWFFHCTNDEQCPYAPIQRLVKKLQSMSNAEIRITSFEDTWSKTGHYADHVAYPAANEFSSGDQAARGGDLFSWMLAQRRST